MIQRIQTNDTSARKDNFDNHSLRITLVRDPFLAARNCCMCKIIRSRNYSPSHQVHMFPRAVMCSSTAYGAVVCIRGLASFSGTCSEFV